MEESEFGPRCDVTCTVDACDLSLVLFTLGSIIAVMPAAIAAHLVHPEALEAASSLLDVANLAHQLAETTGAEGWA